MGFVRSSVADLAFLFVMLIAGIGLWGALKTTVFEGDFTLAFFMVWLVATAIVGWWVRDQPLVLRTPVGFLMFLGLSLVLVPLSWWSGAKIVASAEAAVTAAAAVLLGRMWSKRLASRLDEGATPWYLDQSINLVNDLLRWVLGCIVAWFLVGILPLVLVLALPVEWVPWAAMLWGFGLTAYYLVAVRKTKAKFLEIPLGLWALAVVAVVLQLFEKQIAGPMEPGSIGVIAYAAYAPVVAGLFVEIAVLGTLLNKG
ncbi:MAG TPA: hypothetical protein VGO35_09540 [Gammaproteobacteria bacterium]|jgi:hypothetical protein|nr:hypothetical protein [Gammaproteobacteria bacterium]